MARSRDKKVSLGRLLGKKVLRDTGSLGAASISLMVLMAVGVSLYVIFAEARANLNASVQEFYRRSHFGSATVLVESAPPSLVDSVRLVPGVTEVMGRRVKDGTLILRDRIRRRVQGRFIGIVPGQRSPINDYTVVRGREISGRGECLVEQKFAEANRLNPGDLVTASYVGQRHDFVISGTVASPEYLYPAPDKESPMGMPETFGVCWVDDDALRQWLGIGQIVTEVHALTTPGREDEVVRTMRALGDRYGLRSWWTHEDQPSARLLKNDLQGWQALSLIFPSLFMFAAALSLYSSLNRIIRLQTGVIGFLRASGLSRREVLWHYVLQGALVTACGALPGMVLGHAGSKWMVKMYVGVIQIPVCLTQPYPQVQATAVFMAIAVGVVAAYLPARRAANTPPAIAMRGDAATDRADAAGNRPDNWLVALTRYLPTLLRIPARGLIRKPSRTALAVGGLASGCAILLMTLGLYVSIMDSIGEFLDKMVHYELDVTLSSPQADSLIDALGSIEGVTAITHSAMAPVRVIAGDKQANMTANGVEAGQRTMWLPTTEGKPIQFKPGELWIAQYVAKRLGVKPGDPITVEWAFSGRQKPIRTHMVLGGVMDVTFGGFAMGEYHDLRRRLVDRAYPMAAYGATIACPPEVGRVLKRRLERDDAVVNVISMGDLRTQIYSSMRITRIFIGIMLGFGAILAGAVLHSVSSVGILERMRELATLRSLGFSAQATTGVAALEIYLMAGLGLAVGFPFGTWLNRGFLGSFETDMFTFRSHLPLWTYGFAALVVLTLVSWSLRAGVEKLRTIDLAQATKARE
ncbi:MAG: FtsX-like permease family protein [Armatimonadetes bacterium]|nr:FtsX-like permease family protein [Armatimonadota bacterium]